MSEPAKLPDMPTVHACSLKANQLKSLIEQIDTKKREIAGMEAAKAKAEAELLAMQTAITEWRAYVAPAANEAAGVPVIRLAQHI